MTRAEKQRLFWGTLGGLAALGILLHHAGVSPKTPLEREIIPVDEPTLLDWAAIGGLIFAL